jgi:apolipoprotein N-acyltransferase
VLLVALNNDAWYGNTAAVWQHDTLARWRAIETRRYLAKCDNVGLTNIIDPLGRDTVRLVPYVDDVLVGPVRPMRIETLYTRWGDWFAQTMIVALGALLLLIRPSRRERRTRKR